jgi:hypothetical protein
LVPLLILSCLLAMALEPLFMGIEIVPGGDGELL